MGCIGVHSPERCRMVCTGWYGGLGLVVQGCAEEVQLEILEVFFWVSQASESKTVIRERPREKKSGLTGMYKVNKSYG